MSRPSNPSGVRRAHTRKGKPVRASSIKGRQAPKRRLNANARRRVQRKPMLYAAGTLAGLGALDAILTGRWGGAIVLGSLAGGFLLGHLVWSHHQNRQAMRPARGRPKRSQDQQRREALAKARAVHQPTLEQDLAAARARDAERNEALAKRRRYDEMQAMTKRQRKRGQPERVWPSQYEEFYDGPGQLKPRPSGKHEPAAAPKASGGASNGSAPTSHEEWQTLYGRRCDCTKCRAKRRAESKATKAEAEYARGLDDAVAEAKGQLAQQSRERHERFNTFGDKDEVLR